MTDETKTPVPEASNAPDYIELESSAELMQRDKLRVEKALAYYEDLRERGHASEVAALLTAGIMITDMLGGVVVEIGELRGAEDFPDE